MCQKYYQVKAWLREVSDVQDEIEDVPSVVVEGSVTIRKPKKQKNKESDNGAQTVTVEMQQVDKALVSQKQPVDAQDLKGKTKAASPTPTSKVTHSSSSSKEAKARSDRKEKTPIADKEKQATVEDVPEGSSLLTAASTSKSKPKESAKNGQGVASPSKSPSPAPSSPAKSSIPRASQLSSNPVSKPPPKPVTPSTPASPSKSASQPSSNATSKPSSKASSNTAKEKEASKAKEPPVESAERKSDTLKTISSGTIKAKQSPTKGPARQSIVSVPSPTKAQSKASSKESRSKAATPTVSASSKQAIQVASKGSGSKASSSSKVKSKESSAAASDASLAKKKSASAQTPKKTPSIQSVVPLSPSASGTANKGIQELIAEAAAQLSLQFPEMDADKVQIDMTGLLANAEQKSSSVQASEQQSEPHQDTHDHVVASPAKDTPSFNGVAPHGADVDKETDDDVAEKLLKGFLQWRIDNGFGVGEIVGPDGAKIDLPQPEPQEVAGATPSQDGNLPAEATNISARTDVSKKGKIKSSTNAADARLMEMVKRLNAS